MKAFSAQNLSENAWGMVVGWFPLPSDLTAAQWALIEPLPSGGEDTWTKEEGRSAVMRSTTPPEGLRRGLDQLGDYLGNTL